jgi:hypothetical protein
LSQNQKNLGSKHLQNNPQTCLQLLHLKDCPVSEFVQLVYCILCFSKFSRIQRYVLKLIPLAVHQI